MAIFQLVLGTQQQIAEEHFQKLRCGMDALLQVVIVGAHKCISEVPGVLLKGIVVDPKTEGLHILDHKHGRCPGVTLAKGVNLPDI